MIDTFNTVAEAIETPTETRKKDSKHVIHQKLMMEQVQMKLLRRESHKALINHFLTPHVRVMRQG